MISSRENPACFHKKMFLKQSKVAAISYPPICQRIVSVSFRNYDNLQFFNNHNNCNLELYLSIINST